MAYLEEVVDVLVVLVAYGLDLALRGDDQGVGLGLVLSDVLTVRDVRDELVDGGGYAIGDHAYSSPEQEEDYDPYDETDEKNEKNKVKE